MDEMIRNLFPEASTRNEQFNNLTTRAIQETNTNDMCTTCSKCSRTFKTQRGLNRHLLFCQIENNKTDFEQGDPLINPMPTKIVIWGDLSIEDVNQVVNATYEECVKWKRNLFMLPSGKIGKDYIDECIRLIHEWVNNSPLHDISLKT